MEIAFVHRDGKSQMETDGSGEKDLELFARHVAASHKLRQLHAKSQSNLVFLVSHSKF